MVESAEVDDEDDDEGEGEEEDAVDNGNSDANVVCTTVVDEDAGAEVVAVLCMVGTSVLVEESEGVTDVDVEAVVVLSAADAGPV